MTVYCISQIVCTRIGLTSSLPFPAQQYSRLSLSLPLSPLSLSSPLSPRDSCYTSGPDSALLFDDFAVSCCGQSCEVVDVPGVVYSHVSDIPIIIPYVAVLPRAVDLAELSDFVRFSSVASCRAMSEPEIKQKRKSGYYPIGARTRANGYKGKTGWPSTTKAQQQDDPVLRAFVRILFSTGWLSGCTLHVVSDEHIFYTVQHGLANVFGFCFVWGVYFKGDCSLPPALRGAHSPLPPPQSLQIEGLWASWQID